MISNRLVILINCYSKETCYSLKIIIYQVFWPKSVVILSDNVVVTVVSTNITPHPVIPARNIPAVPLSLVDLGKRLLDASKRGDTMEIRTLMSSGAPFTTDWVTWLTTPLLQHLALVWSSSLVLVIIFFC